NSEPHRISPRPKLPKPRTLLALGVPKTSSKLTSGRFLFQGLGFCLLKFQVAQDFSQTQDTTTLNPGFPWSAKRLLQTDIRKLEELSVSVPVTGLLPAKIQTAQYLSQTKAATHRTMAAIGVPNASSKMTSGNWRRGEFNFTGKRAKFCV
ncbi:hypothetical protein IHE44_0006023, partial [Lamprotornis superbus]